MIFFFVFQKVEVEDLYTWPFKLTQNMVQKNNDKMKKDRDKVPTLRKPQKGGRAHRSKLGSWGKQNILYRNNTNTTGKKIK